MLIRLAGTDPFSSEEHFHRSLAPTPNSPSKRRITSAVALADITTFYRCQSSYRFNGPEEGYTVLTTKQGKSIEINSVHVPFL